MDSWLLWGTIGKIYKECKSECIGMRVLNRSGFYVSLVQIFQFLGVLIIRSILKILWLIWSMLYVAGLSNKAIGDVDDVDVELIIYLSYKS